MQYVGMHNERSWERC